MKKVVSLFLCIVMLLCVSGCGSWDDKFTITYLGYDDGKCEYSIANETNNTYRITAVEFKCSGWDIGKDSWTYTENVYITLNPHESKTFIVREDDLKGDSRTISSHSIKKIIFKKL